MLTYTKVPGGAGIVAVFCWLAIQAVCRSRTQFHEAKAGRTRLVSGVVGLVTVGTTVENYLFCLIVNQALLCFVAWSTLRERLVKGKLLFLKKIEGLDEDR